MAKGLRSKSEKRLRAIKRHSFGTVQADVAMKTSLAQMKIRLGASSEQDIADACVSHRLSGTGFFATDGDMVTKKRFTFTKAAALAKP